MIVLCRRNLTSRIATYPVSIFTEHSIFPRRKPSHTQTMSKCPLTNLAGAAMFLTVPYILYTRRRTLCTPKSGDNIQRSATYTASSIRSLVGKMEVIIQADEGRRGIHEIMPPPGELLNAAMEILTAKKVAIITGFPCMIDYDPPTETDGPLGALAIAKCLLMLGKDVVIATDECNEEVMLACAAASMTHKSNLANGSRTGILTMESFPSHIASTEKDDQRLKELGQSVDLVIAIERTGPCKDGRYLTMRARDMSHLIAPLDLLLMPPGLLTAGDEGGAEPVDVKDWGKPPRSIGIGDGGNEVGMGKVYNKVVASSIMNAPEIACVVPADHLIVASVSNWGGYALAAATAAVALVNNVNTTAPAGENGTFTAEQIAEQITLCSPSAEEETFKCQAIVNAGARDGVSGKLDLFVDGMPLENSLEILQRLRNIAF